MEVKVSLTCEVRYHLIGFGGMSGYYTPKDLNVCMTLLKGCNTDISHEIYECADIDKDGLVILVVITIINLDK